MIFHDEAAKNRKEMEKQRSVRINESKHIHWKPEF